MCDLYKRYTTFPKSNRRQSRIVARANFSPYILFAGSYIYLRIVFEFQKSFGQFHRVQTTFEQHCTILSSFRGTFPSDLHRPVNNFLTVLETIVTIIIIHVNQGSFKKAPKKRLPFGRDSTHGVYTV